MTISKLIKGIFKPNKDHRFAELPNEVTSVVVDLPCDDSEDEQDSKSKKVGELKPKKAICQPEEDLCPEVVHRKKLIHGFKCRYVRLILSIMILSLASSITLAVTMKFLRISDNLKYVECWRWIKMAHIMYATFLSGLLLIGIRCSRQAVLGASLHELQAFDSFGDQVILCLMMVSIKLI